MKSNNRKGSHKRFLLSKREDKFQESLHSQCESHLFKVKFLTQIAKPFITKHFIWFYILFGVNHLCIPQIFKTRWRCYLQRVLADKRAKPQGNSRGRLWHLMSSSLELRGWHRQPCAHHSSKRKLLNPQHESVREWRSRVEDFRMWQGRSSGPGSWEGNRKPPGPHLHGAS